MLSLTSVISHSNSMNLLATTHDGEGGGLAEAHLEITPGDGRVFVESYPVPETDTILSVRFAKDLACQYTYRDCSDYDFFYLIDSGTTFVEGPSAGSALTALTILTLEDKDFPHDVSMTGTINSGGIVGLVGGINSKIEAAKNHGLKEVFIPRVSLLTDEEEIDVYDLPTFKVHPIDSVDDILKNILGDSEYDKLSNKISERKISVESEVDSEAEYYRLMEKISDDMCENMFQIADDINDKISETCIKIDSNSIPEGWEDTLNEDFKSHFINSILEVHNFNNDNFFFDFSIFFRSITNKYDFNHFYSDEDYLTINDPKVDKILEDVYNVFSETLSKNISQNEFIEEVYSKLELYHNSFYFFNNLSSKLFDNLNNEEKLYFSFLDKEDRFNYLSERINYVNSSLLNEEGNFLCLENLMSTNIVDERYEYSIEMKEENNFYSRASFCFSASSELRNIYNSFNKPNPSDLIERVNNTYKELDESLEDKEIKNYFDFQARMISNDRLIEGKEGLMESINIFDEFPDVILGQIRKDDLHFITPNNFLDSDYSHFVEGDDEIDSSFMSRLISDKEELNLFENIFYPTISHSMERLRGIEGWFYLFESNLEDSELDEDILKRTCLEKLSQAEERAHGISNYIPSLVDDDLLKNAHSEYEESDYVNCIYLASKAKANSDLLLGTMGISDEHITELIDIRLPIARNMIEDSINRGYFPIMGYNYLEYSESLKESDSFSSLLFSEYAIELSSLDSFFYSGKEIDIEKERLVCLDDEIESTRDGLVQNVLIFISGVFIILSLLLIFELSKVKEIKDYLKYKKNNSNESEKEIFIDIEEVKNE